MVFTKSVLVLAGTSISLAILPLLSLLEAGEHAQSLYAAQSHKAMHDFLIKGIELANECDLKFKVSQNQRLLVELCLMQLASITFDGEKKK